MNEFLDGKAKEQRKFMKEYKNEDFKQTLEAKKENFVETKANFFDDLQRSV